MLAANNQLFDRGEPYTCVVECDYPTSCKTNDKGKKTKNET